MPEEYNREPRRPIGFRPYYDVGMGLLYLCISYYIFSLPKEKDFLQIGGVKFFMFIFIAYGAFRLIRGIYIIITSIMKK